jgi:hypothetical protein
LQLIGDKKALEDSLEEARRQLAETTTASTASIPEIEQVLMSL